MTVAKPTRVQILLAWRINKWVVAKDNVDVAAFAYRPHAMACVRKLAAEAWRARGDCYLLIREPDGRWKERPCPRPPRLAAHAECAGRRPALAPPNSRA